MARQYNHSAVEKKWNKYWKEPYSYDNTAKEEIEDSFFEYSNEGLRKIVEYLNHVYKERFNR